MLLAAQGSFAYNLLFLLHLLAIIMAFAPAFIWPVVNARLQRSGHPLGSEIGGVIRDTWGKLYGPALALAGLFGIGLISVGDGIEFNDTWITIALLLWFLMLAVVFGLMPWNERRAAEGHAGAQQRSAAFTGILHLLLVLMLIDMIWKPT